MTLHTSYNQLKQRHDILIYGKIRFSLKVKIACRKKIEGQKILKLSKNNDVTCLG